MDFEDLFGDLLQHPDPGPQPPYAPKCQLCGKFRRASQLRLVYTGAPHPKPDYEACTTCLGKDQP